MSHRGVVPGHRAEQFPPASPEIVERWATFGKWADRMYFPKLVGLQMEEVRTDYCRMRMPFRPDIEQPAGVVHGGAIATILDTVVVPAVGSAYTAEHRYSTVDLHVQYIAALVQEDGIAEGWIVKRGRSTVFCEAELVGADSHKLIARGLLTYNVSAPRA
ncbi:MAG: PaaI family thioesterase [Ilumatobacteraceae bacterium]|nr:PaaI family thioesterase [Ilumatobacter sp.]MCB0983398.1 PaaI family thioesterase [Ilumatobacter sp.]